jgi:hypothetical protein
VGSDTHHSYETEEAQRKMTRTNKRQEVPHSDAKETEGRNKGRRKA